MSNRQLPIAAHIPLELLHIIGLKLDSTGDRIRFRAVSKSWRSALPFRQPPWLMLSESPPEPNQPIPPPRGLFPIGDHANSIHRVDLPEIHQARVVGCTAGWLITTHLDKTVRMTNPFTRAQFNLPSHFKTVPHACDAESFSPEDYRDELVWKVVLSSPPRDDSDRGCVAMAIHSCDSVLATATPDDVWWTTVRVVGSRDLKAFGVKDVVYYNQQFYAVSGKGNLMVCNFGGSSRKPRFMYLSGYFFEKLSVERKLYLVEWLGELLMVVRFLQFPDGEMYRTISFQIYQFDFENKKFEKINSLGEHSLFLGYNTSVSVLASDYYGLVRKNCIYFTDDCKVGYFDSAHDMGVFDLEDHSITPYLKGIPTSPYSPPVWIVPG